MRRGTSDIPDADAAEELIGWMKRTMTNVATGDRIDDSNDDYVLRFRALRAVLKRLGMKNPNPHQDLWAFYRYWSENDLGTYASRRSYVADLYEEVQEHLDEVTYDELLEPVAGRPTGWPEVDRMVSRLRSDYQAARDATAYKAIGLQIVTLLQGVGRLVFDPERHQPDREVKVSPDDAKRRIGLFVDSVTQGRGSTGAQIRKLSGAAVQLAESIKHSADPDRIETGIAADAAIAVANLVRRVSELDVAGTD
jgi:hypothetical protein